MKTYKNLYEKICAFENLHRAYVQTRSCKRYRAEILEFSHNLEKNLLKMQQDLVNQTYQHGSYREFVVCDSKRRVIKAAPFRDRVVHHALCNIIEPLFDKGFISDSYACRKGKGTHKAIKKVQSYLRATGGKAYFLQCDISKYFSNIDHDVLLSMIGKKINDNKTMWLIEKIIESSFDRLSAGIPIGNLTSQLFANVYLNELDQFVKHQLREKYYLRYMDDFLIFGFSKKSLFKLKEILKNFLADKLKLAMHPNKATVFPARAGISFLGYKIFGSHRLLRKSTVKRFIKRVILYKKWIAAGIMTTKKFNKSLESWKAYAQFGNSWKLRYKLALSYGLKVLLVFVFAFSFLSYFPGKSYASAGYITGKFKGAYNYEGDFYTDAGNVGSGIKTASFWINGGSGALGKVLDFNGSVYISISGGTISLTGFSGTTYVDGVTGSTVDSSWHFVAVTTTTGIDANAVKFGSVEFGNLNGSMDDVKFYSYALSAREISEKYRQGSPSLALGGTVDGDLYIMSSGKVGIGTTSPSAMLAVGASSQFQVNSTGDITTTNGGELTIGGTGNSSIAGNLGIGTTGPLALLDVNGSAWLRGVAGGTGGLFATAGGNIGIGTTNPLALLHVEGQCVTGDTLLKRRRRRRGKNGERVEEWEDVRIDEIKPGDEILTLNEATGEFVVSQVEKLMDMGYQDVFQLITETGKKIRTTGNHPYFSKKQTQVLGGTFEVDQSNRLEDLGKDSYIAVANLKHRFVISISKEEKRRAFAYYQKEPKKFGPILWARSIAYITRQQFLRGARLILDDEYQGYKELINQVIFSLNPTISIDFREIGKNSPAHVAAYEANPKTLGHKKATGALGVTQVAEDVLHPELTGIRTPSSRLSKNYHSLSDLSRAKWRKVDELTVGDVVGTLDGWESIVYLGKTGREQTYDIQVANTHNFIGNGIVAHNTYMSGNLGIGTTGPGAKLELAGNLLFSKEAARTLTIDRTTTAATGGYNLTLSASGAVSGGTDLSGGHTYLTSGISTGSGGSNIYLQTSGGGATGTADRALTTRMTILGNGNVGIGTTGPLAPLDIRTTGYPGFILTSADVTHGMTNLLPTTNTYAYFGTSNLTKGGAAFYGASDTNDTPGFNVTGVIGNADPVDTTPALILAGGKANGTGWQALGSLETVFQLYNYGTPLVTALGSGNVGIGTTGPSALLSVGSTSQFQVNTTGDITTSATGELTIGGTGNSSIAGNLGIGTTGPAATLHIVAPAVASTAENVFKMGVSDDANSSFSIRNNTTADGQFLPVFWGINGTDNREGLTFIGENAAAYDSGTTAAVRIDGRRTGGALQTKPILSIGSYGNVLVLVDKSGNLGIGTTGPSALLSVGASSQFQVNTTGDITTSNGGELTIGGTGNSSIAGNVGIGTTGPAGKLHVVGECVAEGTLIRRRRRKKNGQWEEEDIPVEEIEPGDEVFSLNETTGKFEWHKVEKTMDKGVQKVFELATSSGKRIETTTNHPYLVLKQSPYNSDFIYDNIFAATEGLAKRFYFGVLAKWDPFVPSLGEKIEISRVGWEHLHEKTRRKSEMLFRYFALPKIVNILQDPDIKPLYETGRDTKQKVEFWHFEAIVDDVAIKVVLRSIKGGRKHLFSVMWKGEVDGDKKEGAVFRILKRSRGMITPQLQNLYTTFVKSCQEAEMVKWSNGQMVDNNLPKEWIKVSDLSEGMWIATVDGWEEIAKIKEVGRKQVYDLQIEGTKNFVANRIVAHNTYIMSGNLGIGTTNPVQKLHVEGQCITGDSLLPTLSSTPSSGQEANGSWLVADRTQIKDVKPGMYTYSLNEETGKIVPAKVKGLFDMGTKPVFEIRTAGGQSIKTTGNHPYLVRLDQEGGEENGSSIIQLRAAEGVAERYGLDEEDLSEDKEFSQIRTIWLDGSTPPSSHFDSTEYSRGAGSTSSSGVYPVSVSREGIALRDNNLPEASAEFGVLEGTGGTTTTTGGTPNPQTTQRPDQSRQGTKASWIKVIYLREGDQIAVPYQQLATSNQPYVLWDTIVSIEYVGEEQVYDVEVEGTHNFVANGILAHNTYMSGNLGIGTTGPSYVLDVSSNSAAAGSIRMANSGGSARLRLESTDPVINRLAASDLYFGETTDSGKYVFRGTGNVLFNNNGGNVGIGTTSPSAMLAVGASSQFQVNSTGDITTSSTGELTIGGTGNSSIAGNLGIGTTGPNAKLEVYSTATTTDISKITSTALTSGKALNIAATSNDYTSGNLINAGLTQAAATGTSVSGDIVNIAFSPTYSTAITTPAISGNVLDVSRTAVTNADFGSNILTVSGAVAVFSDSATQTQGTLTSTADVVQILQNYNSNTGAALNITTSASGAGALALRVNDNGNLNDSTAFVVDADGNVGIGTTGPASKLEVSGGDIRVTGGSFIDDGTTLSAPDYVFEVDYHLPTLSELKDYIRLNKHLPNLPGMDDTAGWAALSLQARDMKLLEKIEENTLYILGLNDQLSMINDRMNDQLSNVIGTIGPMGEMLENHEARITNLEEATESATLRVSEETLRVNEEEATPSADDDENPTGSSVNPSGWESGSAPAASLGDYDELTIKETLTSIGKTYLADTNIAGTLTVGLITFDELENSLNSLAGPLKLQANALQKIEFEGGKITMDTNGDLHIKEGVIYGNESMRNAVAVPTGVAKFKVQSAKFKITVQNSKCEEAIINGEEAAQDCELNWTEAPVVINATPSWNTTVWVTDITENGFTINFGTPPSQEEKVYWQALW